MSEANSTTPTPPDKPSEGFPLFAHARGALNHRARLDDNKSELKSG